MNYEEKNIKAIESWIEEGWRWGTPISDEEYLAATKGEFSLLLTPNRPLPKHWLLPIAGKKVLGLASGGGQQIPILSALGAKCTLLELSDKQIASDVAFAKRHNYEVEITKASFTKPFPYKDNTFDMVVNPISLCYARELKPIFVEIARVLRPGGVLLIGLDNGTNYLTNEEEKEILFSYPFDPLSNEEQAKELENDDAGVQFSHGIEESIGGLIAAGFRLEEIREDTNEYGRLAKMGIPTCYAIKARLEK